MKVALISHTQEPQKLIELCARVSYKSQNEPFNQWVNSTFIKTLIKNGHESPLEHAVATFLIDGISRTCSHQIVRHRLASFSQRSGRYTTTNGEVVNPFEIDKENENYKAYEEAVKYLQSVYETMLKNGAKKEDARFVLPQGECTTLYMTANFREWRHFLHLRLDQHAQWEIRGVAKEILDKLLVIAPDVFSDLIPNTNQ